MSSCPKSGVRICPSNNDYRQNPFASTPTPNNRIYLEKYQTEIDLNIDNYTQEELYKLLGIYGQELNETMLKSIRLVVLKTHPDKSGLKSDYFIFFSKAYNRLCSIYKFQNKMNSTNKIASENEDENVMISEKEKETFNAFFQSNSHLKENNQEFNSWFNHKFQECTKDLDEKEKDSGYGDWLRSNQDISSTSSLQELENKKKLLQQVIVHTGVMEYQPSSSISCSDLDEINNYTSTTFTDVKQAYTESVIPVTQYDLDNVKQFQNVNEYKKYRDTEQKNVKNISQQESEKILQQKQMILNQQSARIAYKWNQDYDRSKVANDKFQSEIKRIAYK
jgi:hypothetical protein